MENVTISSKRSIRLIDDAVVCVCITASEKAEAYLDLDTVDTDQYTKPYHHHQSSIVVFLHQ